MLFYPSAKADGNEVFSKGNIRIEAENLYELNRSSLPLTSVNGFINENKLSDIFSLPFYPSAKADGNEVLSNGNIRIEAENLYELNRSFIAVDFSQRTDEWQ